MGLGNLTEEINDSKPKGLKEVTADLNESFDNACDNNRFAIAEKGKREQCAEALFLKAAGRSYEQITASTGLARATVEALESRHDEVQKEIKAMMASGLTATANKSVQVAAMKLDQLATDPDALAKASFKDITLGMAVTIDKAALINGEATSIVEHRKAISFENYQASIQAAQAKHAIDVEERNVTPKPLDHPETLNSMGSLHPLDDGTDMTPTNDQHS